MKILILNWKDLQHSNKGGAEEYIFQIATNWMESGLDVKIMVPGHKSSEKCDVVSSSKLMHVGNSFSAHLIMHRSVSKLLRDWKPDIVIETVNTIPFFFVPKVISKRRGIRYLKLIFQTTEEIWKYELNPVLGNVGKYILEPLWLRTASKYPTATISESSKLSLSKFGHENIIIFPIGSNTSIETIQESAAKVKKLDVVFCARLVQMKQPVHAISAFLIAKATDMAFAESNLHVIGDGPQFLILKERYMDEKSIIFHGYIHREIRDVLFQESSFLLATSIREGWGLTVSESASFGVMPVGYRTPGLIDSISFAGGIVTEPDPQSLAKGLSEAMLQIQVKPFTPAAQLKDWRDVGSEILESIICRVPKT